VYRKQVRRRRGVLVALIVISLVLISISFSESESGPVHSVQSAVSSVLSPIEEGASRALKPARDLVNWFDETFDARGENEDLRAQVQELRQRAVEAESALGENEQLREALELRADVGLDAVFDPVTARVIERSPTLWWSTVGIDKGSSAGVELNDPVITGDGLVGRVSEVQRGSAVVEMITDHRSAVSARVPDGPQGMVEPEVGNPDELLLDFIEGSERVKEGETLVTAGWSDPELEIASTYPPGIPIGEVTEATVGEQDTFQQVHVRPFVDMRDLDFVQVLAGGPERPGVPG
jgi:rod shape-determining protein MreC